MPSPDWTEYVDLTLYDKTANDLFNEAIEYARNVLPEWVPEPGNTEVVLLEAIATEASNVVTAINRVPGATTETLLKLFGVERSDGSRATTTIQVIVKDSNGYTIPAGTPFAYFPPDNTSPLVYNSDEDIVIPNGSVVGSVPATASAVGVEYNEPSTGSAVQLLATVPYIQSSTLTTQPGGGADAESDAEFFERAINTLQSYSAALTTPDQISQYVLVNFPDTVYRCKAFDRERAADRDRASAVYTPGIHTGYVLVAVAGENADKSDTSDTSLTAAERQEIQDDLQSRVNPGLVVEVVNADIVTVDFTDLDIVKQDGYTAQQVKDAVFATLDSYLSTNNWEWANVVRANEVIALIDNVSGVDYVTGTPTFDVTNTDEIIDETPDLGLRLVGALTTPALDWEASGITVT